MQDEVIVSYVVTVFNKEPYVGTTVESLLRQEGSIPAEFIFVDDASTDRSLEVIADMMQGHPNVTIVKNSDNAGPSVRLNQGAKLARGRYLQFIDSDDVLAINATAVMLSLIETHDADVVHGGWEKTGVEAAGLIGRRVPDDAPYVISEAPLDLVFEERVLRMAQMVRRDTFLVAGGCDEKVFIQDESLALRLARVARRFILLKRPVLLIPKVEGALSRNVSQLNHDRFLASRDMLCDFPTLGERTRRLLYRRCMSAVWKQCRYHSGLRAAFSPIFARYLQSKCLLLPVDERTLEEMTGFFASVEGVRRVAA